MRRIHTEAFTSILSILMLTLILVFLSKPITAVADKLYLISAIIESEDINISVNNRSAIKTQSKYNNLFDYQLRSGSELENKQGMKLSFYIPYDTTNHANFEVQALESLYLMRPARNIFKKGFYTFTWSEKIMNSLNIYLSDLIGLGYLRSAQYYILPVIIHDTELPLNIKVQTYSFVFVTTVRGNARVRIIHTKSKSILFEEEIAYIIPNSSFLVQWELDTNPTLNIPEGELTLSVVFKSESLDWHQYQYTFYHKHVLETENGESFSGDRLEGVIIFKDI